MAIGSLLASCTEALYMTDDEITYRYDAAITSLDELKVEANKHCAETKRRAKLMRDWSYHGLEFGIRGASFKCVSDQK